MQSIKMMEKDPDYTTGLLELNLTRYLEGVTDPTLVDAIGSGTMVMCLTLEKRLGALALKIDENIYKWKFRKKNL